MLLFSAHPNNACESYKESCCDRETQADKQVYFQMNILAEISNVVLVPSSAANAERASTDDSSSACRD